MKLRQNGRSLRTFKCQECGCIFKSDKFTIENPAQPRKSATSQCPMCGAWAYPDYSRKIKPDEKAEGG